MPTLHLDGYTSGMGVPIASAEGMVLNYNRTGWVDDIDFDGANTLLQVLSLTGMPAMGSALSASFPTCTLGRVLVRPSTTIQRRAYLELQYSSAFGALLSAAVVTNRAWETMVETDYIPGTRKLIQTRYQKGLEKLKKTTLRMVLPVSMREISIAAIVFGATEAPPALLNSHNAVNANPWQGLPKGYWRVTGAATAEPRYEASYSYQWSAVTKCEEDWAAFVRMMHPQTGNYLGTQADQDQLSALPYLGQSNRGLFRANGVGAASVDLDGGNQGIVRVDAFRELDFDLILNL
jgi:hypothetical protein